jgi:hypothetical protein
MRKSEAFAGRWICKVERVLGREIEWQEWLWFWRRVENLAKIPNRGTF